MHKVFSIVGRTQWTNNKQKLLSASAKAIRTCVKFNTRDISFVRLHELYNRATPEQFLLYKHALSLHKLYNTNDYTVEWTALNFNQSCALIEVL